jgi:hypothetical protein
MENNWENLDKESRLTIKELTKDNENFSKLMAKLNSARENLDNKPEELVVALQKIKK